MTHSFPYRSGGCSKYVVVANARLGRGHDFGRIFADTSLAQRYSTLIRKYVFSIDSRHEPYEVILHVRICERDGQQWPFLPRRCSCCTKTPPWKFGSEAVSNLAPIGSPNRRVRQWHNSGVSPVFTIPVFRHTQCSDNIARQERIKSLRVRWLL